MLNFLNSLIFNLSYPYSLAIIFAFMCILGLIAYLSKHLTLSGVAGAVLFGTAITYTLRIEGLILFGLFYVSSNICSKICSRKCRAHIEAKGSCRDFIQVAANGFLAVLAGFMFYFGVGEKALVMFGAVVAEAMADTCSGEIGRLSKVPPVSIRNRMPVEKGMSGGVTLLGLLGGILSSLVIAVFWCILFNGSAFHTVIVCMTGFLGSVADSFMGATFQALYEDSETGKLTEHSFSSAGEPNKLVRGIRFADNDMVNFLSNLFTAVLSLALCV